MPIRGRVSTAYGLQRYVNGHFDYRHKGMDIAAPLGSPLKAAADGVVSLAEESFLLHGKTIILDHGEGVATLYLHLSEIAVSPGEEVKQGQVIGRIGATGAATGPHLHYAVYVRHEAVDPLFWTHLPAL
jgi:murein DD-endopeptidase MepM/ murein hydrolase activator NlpD